MVARTPTAPRSLVARSWDVLARSLTQHGSVWTVHSVFQHAFNLRGPDDILLGVVTAPAGNAPSTLVLAYDRAAEPFTSLLSPGDPARLTRDRSDYLVIPGRLVLDLSTAVLWNPSPIKRTLDNREIGTRLRRAVEIAISEAPAAGLAVLLWEAESLASEPAPDGQPNSAFSQGRPPGIAAARGESALAIDRALAQLRLLVAAIREQRWTEVYSAARALSGLGPGLTPAGDDLLAGLALGLRATLGSLPPPLQAVLHAAVEGRTTDLAIARVRHAVDGRADEAIDVLLLAMVTGTGKGLDEAVRTTIAYGHSSGADTLVGLLVGLWLGVTMSAPA